jgi:hypothetical protein
MADAKAMRTALNALFSTECGVLPIGDRHGWTSYIDFIRPDELADASIMKGADALGRRFIVFKCTVHASPPHRLFTTLFQRYQSDADETLYHTAGHHGTHLFTTTGGASVTQVERLVQLLHAGRIDLAVDEMTQLRIGYRDHSEIERMDPATIDSITVGW